VCERERERETVEIVYVCEREREKGRERERVDRRCVQERERCTVWDHVACMV